ncbi:MAG: hemerythrin domain-containing protein [Bdellovibrionales bacterium]
MSIFEAVRFDHREIDYLLNKLINLRETDEVLRADLINHLNDSIIPHCQAEEVVLYIPLRVREGAGCRVIDSFQDHMRANNLLLRLESAEKIDHDWIVIAKLLKEVVDRHINDEEARLLTSAQTVFTSKEARKMGAEFEKMKAQIRKARHKAEPSHR